MSKQWEKETTNDGMTTGHLLPKWKNPIIKNEKWHGYYLLLPE